MGNDSTRNCYLMSVNVLSGVTLQLILDPELAEQISNKTSFKGYTLLYGWSSNEGQDCFLGF